jgi:hypothetical protein
MGTHVIKSEFAVLVGGRVIPGGTAFEGDEKTVESLKKAGVRFTAEKKKEEKKDAQTSEPAPAKETAGKTKK